jgi:DNA-binding PucR family transcriptional regulator
VCTFDGIPFMSLVAATTNVHWTDLPEWLRVFLAEDEKRQREWSTTAEALSNSGGRVKEASASLHLHSNSVYYRLVSRV